MKRLFLFLLILLIAVFLGIMLYKDSGYALFAYRDWTVEAPLWLVMVALLITFLLFHELLRILKYSTDLPKKWRSWSFLKRKRRSEILTKRGFLEFAEGKWFKAESDLVKGATFAPIPLMNFLFASKAAQEQAAYQRRDDYLSRAYQVDPQAEMAIGLTKTKLQLDQHQLEQALATLNHLRELDPKHPTVLKLLQQVYWELGNWEALLELIPYLRKYKIISGDEARELKEVLRGKIG